MSNPIDFSAAELTLTDTSKVLAVIPATEAGASDTAGYATVGGLKNSLSSELQADIAAVSADKAAVKAYRDEVASMLSTYSTGKRYGLRIRVSDGYAERIGDAAGLTFRRWAGSAPALKSDFASLTPWANNRLGIADHLGNVVAVKGDTNYEALLADTTGEYSQGTLFHCYYGRDELVTIDSVEYRYIEVSDRKLEGLEAMPAFLRTDGTVREYVFVCAALSGTNSSGKFQSTAGLSPKIDTNINGFSSFFDANAASGETSKWVGAHFTVNDVWRYLLIVEMGGLNSQGLVGSGISSGMPYGSSAGYQAIAATSDANTVTLADTYSSMYYVGMTVNVGASYYGREIASLRAIESIDASVSGQITLTLDGAAFSVSVGNFCCSLGQPVPQTQLAAMGLDCGYYLQYGSETRSHVFAYGLCDPWGNCWTFEYGKARYDDMWYVNWNAASSKSISDPRTDAGWEATGIGGYFENEYLKTVYVYRKNGRFCWMPASSGAGSSTYYCDYAYYFSSQFTGTRVLLVGGDWSYGSVDGVFCVLGYYTPSSGSIYVASRAASMEPLAA